MGGISLLNFNQDSVLLVGVHTHRQMEQKPEPRNIATHICLA